MTSFPQFSRFPIELRRCVWSYLLPPPVIQEPRIDLDPYSGERVLFAGAAHPVLLRVCRESRVFALKHYTLAFTRSYVDFAIDTIYFYYNTFDWYQTDFELLERRTKPSDRAKICHMAIDCQMWNDTASSPDGVDFDKVAESVLIDKLKAYPNVQTLTLVIRMPECEPGCEGLLEFVEEPRLGLWDRHSILQEFLLWNKWDIPGFTSDEEDLETFEMEKQDVAKQIQRLQVKYPDKKFPEIRWRFIQFEGEYF